MGVSRQTLSGWANRDPFFKAEFNARRQDVWRSGQDRLRSLLPAALGAVARGLVSEQGWRVGLKVLEMAGFAGDYSQTGPANAAAFLDEAARARRGDPFEALIGACGNPPITEEEREGIVRDLAREGVLDAGPDEELTT